MRQIRQIGEVGLIERIRRRLKQRPSVLVGIGDDAAVLRKPARGELLFACDMLVEGVHFLRRRTAAKVIGWKALAVNVSDIAAMGGIPLWAVVSLGLPPTTPVAFVDGLYAGLQACARRYGVSVVGGDTSRAAQVVIDVAIIGSVAAGKRVLRSGARVGDCLFVTGKLGGSYASGRHARFTPRLREAQALLRRVRVHAMLDLSDGLASDLWQLSRASRVVLRVDAVKIPVSPDARGIRQALMDGEDFELLFAVAAAQAKRVPRRLDGCPVTEIGRAIGKGVGVQWRRRGGIRPLYPEGFSHF